MSDNTFRVYVTGYKVVRVEDPFGNEVPFSTRPADTVFVVSQHGEGSGGFWWYPTREAAETGYDAEIAAWAGLRDHERTIRLLEVAVPTDIDGDDLTEYLDDMIDDLEDGLPALREYVTNHEGVSA